MPAKAKERTQAELDAEAAARLKKAEQALAKARIKEREEAAQPPRDELAAFKYTGKERAALQRIREGLGLPGTRFETDTTSALAVKTRKAVRDTLNLRRAEGHMPVIPLRWPVICLKFAIMANQVCVHQFYIHQLISVHPGTK